MEMPCSLAPEAVAMEASFIQAMGEVPLEMPLGGWCTSRDPWSRNCNAGGVGC